MAARLRYSLPVVVFLVCLVWWRLEQRPNSIAGAVELRWIINSQERDVRFAEAARAAFEQANPGIRVQFIKTNEGHKLETMIAGGDAPDVLSFGLEDVYFYLRAGALRDLRPLMSQEDRQDLSSFFPITLKPYTRGDAVYALPWAYVPFIVFYNKALFDRARLPYPSDDWTWDEYRTTAMRLTRDLDSDGFTDEFGASFAQWQDGFYCWFAQNGASVLSEDGRAATFSNPKVVEAVRFLAGLSRTDRVLPTEANKPKQTGMGLFESGRLAMNGPTGSFFIPSYRDYPKLDWDIAPVPRGPAGRGTIVAPIGFGVSSQSAHPAEAYKLVRFLCSEAGQRILANSGLFVPCRKTVAYSSEYLQSSERPHNRNALISMMDDRDGKVPWGVLPPWSGARWGDVQDEALNSKLGSFLFGAFDPAKTPESVCADIDISANRIMQSERAASRGRPIPWLQLFVGIAAVLGAIGITSFRSVKRHSVSRRAREDQRWGLLAVSPWVIGFIGLGVGPLLVSFLASFTTWDALSPISEAKVVGLYNYSTILGSDELFGRAVRATSLYAALCVPIGLVGGLMLALLMNQRIRGIEIFRTLYYLPAVMPVVAAAVLFNWIFRQQGILNYVLGGFGHTPMNALPNWLGDSRFAIPAIVLMGLWGVGGGMMIYLAGLQNIPTQLYEAAKIDGAGAWTQFRRITLPMLSPVLLFNLVMGVIGALQAFASVFVLFGGGAGPDDSALLYGFYLYRKAFDQFQVGYASALAWILFAVIVLLTALIFRSSAMWVYYESERPAEGAKR